MSIDAMKQALEALEMYLRLDTVEDGILFEQVIAPEAITALRAAIEKEKKRSKDHWCTSCNGVEPYNCKFNTRCV